MSETSRKSLWVAVIAANVAILGLIGYRVIQAMDAAVVDSRELAWSEPVPELGTFTTTEGRQVALETRGGGRHLLLLFFDPSAAGPASSVLSALASTLPSGAPVEAVGVFAGEAADFESLAESSAFEAPILLDPQSSLRRTLRLAPDPSTGHSVVIDPEGRVGLVLQGIVPAHLLVDYLWREALGREDTPPIYAEQDIAPSAGAPGVAAPAAPEGWPSSLGTAFDAALVRSVEKVSDLSVFRLRHGADGTLVALSRSQSRVFVLDRDLRPIRSFGGFGQGPGRFMMPSDLVLDDAGGMVVVDAGNGRLQGLDGAGEVRFTAPLEVDVISLARLGDQLMVSAPGLGSSFARVEISGDQASMRPLPGLWEIPWLEDRLAGSFEGDLQRRAQQGFQAALNRSYVRPLPGGGFVSVPIWEPRLRRYDSEGALLFEKSFDFSGSEEKTALFEEMLQDAIDQRHLGVLHLFQDLGVSLDGESLALTVIGQCPGVVILSARGEVVEQVCLQDEQGAPVAAVTLAQRDESSWWVGNSSGIFRLEL